MSLVVNMQQRRTVASGRQNQDPNTTVVTEKEKTPKKALYPKIERSIQEVLNHTRNTSGRGRQMVLAALQKKAAAEKTPPAKPSQSGKNLHGDSAKKNGHAEGARAAVVPIELVGNKISISDIRKRPLDQEESRAPLSALNGYTPSSPVRDWTDLAVISPAKPSPSQGTAVYKKRQKTGTTPPTPPLRTSGRRQETKATPPTPPLRTSGRRQETKATPPPLPSPVFESNNPVVIDERVNSPKASMPVVEQVAEIDSLQPVRRQLLSPSPTERESDPYGFRVEEPTPLAPLRGSETQVLEVETQTFFIPKSIRRLHGLMNLGNTCYMNVIVQILCNLPSFVNGMERFFGPLVKQNALEGADIFPDIESVYAALLKVFRDLKRAERSETVNPTVLKYAFAKHQLNFWGCIQQDAHEFFCSLIDQVQEDVSSELKKQYSVVAERPKLETVCPTTQNFSCSVRNNLTCAGCGNVSFVEETYRDFSLALPEDERTVESQNCTLDSLLNLYFQETTMSRKCEKCGVEDTKAQAQILKLPHVLVLQLKRLHMDRDVPCTKVSAPVKFTSSLDIGPWCARDKQKFWSPTTDDVQNIVCTKQNGLGTNSGEDSMDCGLASSFDLESDTTPKTSTSYMLHGVVNHLGHNAFGGHFLSDILDPEADRWLRCDDSLVTDVSEESVFANVREAYMFFYVHESVASKSSD